jgi:hypothetical protein
MQIRIRNPAFRLIPFARLNCSITPLSTGQFLEKTNQVQD